MSSACISAPYDRVDHHLLPFMWSGRGGRIRQYPQRPCRCRSRRNTAMAVQSGGASGTAARCANGDRPTIHYGALVPLVTTLSKNPPATGSAPIAADGGGQPADRQARPRPPQATRSVRSSARRPVRRRSPVAQPVIAAPAQMASPAITCSRTRPAVVTAISVPPRRIRETSVANSGGPSAGPFVGDQRGRAASPRRGPSVSPAGRTSAAAKPFAESRPANPAAAASSANRGLVLKNSRIDAISAPRRKK